MTRNEYEHFRDAWHKDQSGKSFHDMKHPGFQAIINSYMDVVPYIIEDIKKEPSWIVIALSKIFGFSPIKEESRGKLKELCQDWIEWYDNWEEENAERERNWF